MDRPVRQAAPPRNRTARESEAAGKGTLAPASERAAGRGPCAPCLDSVHSTEEGPTNSLTTSRSALKRFQEESGLSWSEIARRIGTYRPTVWRWAEGRVRPNVKHMMALLELAKDLGLGHLFTE